jgi:mycofactocin glycosyltransferase
MTARGPATTTWVAAGGDRPTVGGDRPAVGGGRPAVGGGPPAPPIVLDAGVRRYRGGRVLVGREGRILRLSPAGVDALDALLGGARTPAARALGRRLVEAGLAHPRPAPVGEVDVTVVVPVRDRAAELDRCLAAIEHPAIVVDDGSRDPAAIAAVAARHGARLLRRSVAGGPAAARNHALAHVDSALVAFVDSDCVVARGWVRALAGHFDDPRVAAAAPRVRDRALDMGAREADVAPGTRVSYVPSAALVVRRAALGAGFDERLRYGEDVDLVWRLRDRGWRIRYDPRVEVAHGVGSRRRGGGGGPRGGGVHRDGARTGGARRGLIVRRFRYGTSAAPLALRHPGRLAPVVISPAPAAILALLLARRPRTAAAILAVQSLVIGRGLHRVGAPLHLAPVFAVRGLAGTARGPLRNPAYLAGVVAGAVRHRTLAPLTPRWRSSWPLPRQRPPDDARAHVRNH